MNNHEFYVTLPSTGSSKEFTTNQANHFKVRLPITLNLTGNHWKVALAGITLPDTTLNIQSHIKFKGEKIVAYGWHRYDPGRKQYKPEGHTIYTNKIKDWVFLQTGEQWMKTITDTLIRARNMSLASNESLVDPITKKTMYTDLRWEPVGADQELVLDNSKMKIRHVGAYYPPRFYFDLGLALQMEWLVYDETSKTYALGNNLIPEFPTDTMIDKQDREFSIFVVGGKIKLWSIYEGDQLQLNPMCNWRFRNLNAAYHRFVGTSSTRTLHIYSDVGASSIVGGQITDLLREIQYERQGRGTVYVEPQHLQYRPIRRNVIETIQVQISETNGQLVQFTSPQPCTITLVFKNDV